MFEKEIQKIEQSKEYGKELYLTSCFFLQDWQFTYYNQKTKKMKTFAIVNDEVKVLEQNTEPFQKEEKIIQKLDFTHIKVPFQEVLILIDNLMSSKYRQTATQRIVSLHQENIPFWNITYITASLQILNVKVNAITAEIISEKMQNAMDFKVKDLNQKDF